MGALSLMSRRAAAAEILEAQPLRAEIGALAAQLGLPRAEADARALSALQSMLATQSPFFSLLGDHVLGPMHTKAWTIDVNADELTRLEELQREKSLVFLPTHRSYADAFIVKKVLHEAGFPRNYILGGDNLGFFPLGTIARRSGAVFIRRSFGDDEIYKSVVRGYMRHLATHGANLEWYMEGGRSRTGKLRPPKYGLLKYLADAIDGDDTRDMLLVPVSLTYDRLHEIGSMAEEEAGAAKAKEGVRWLSEYAQAHRKWLGHAYLRFGEPLSLKTALSVDQSTCDGAPTRWTVDKVAFEVFQRINRVTPVTAPALVTLALLGTDGQALTLAEIGEFIDPLLTYAQQRQLPTAAVSNLSHETGIAEVLDILVSAGVVVRYDQGLVPVFGIREGQHAVAAFYRNSAIHWFVNRAIIELGVMAGASQSNRDSIDRGWDFAFALRDLLKFEFFFSEKQAFREEIKAEAALIDPNLQAHISARKADVAALTNASFLIAHRVLPSFLEAYALVAERLAAQPVSASVTQEGLLSECSRIGRQYLMQKRLKHPECLSRELFANAFALARNRGLLNGDESELQFKRAAFAEEAAAALAAVEVIAKLDRERACAEGGDIK